MRRMFALWTVAALAAAVVGSAAALSVNGGAIQAGDDQDVTCTEEANVLGWGLETDSGEVSFVRIGLEPNTCDGNTLFVSVTSEGEEIASGSVELPNATSSGGHMVPFDDPVDAEAITDIHIFIEGQTGDPDDEATNG